MGQGKPPLPFSGCPGGHRPRKLPDTAWGVTVHLSPQWEFLAQGGEQDRGEAGGVEDGDTSRP